MSLSVSRDMLQLLYKCLLIWKNCWCGLNFVLIKSQCVYFLLIQIKNYPVFIQELSLFKSTSLTDLPPYEQKLVLFFDNTEPLICEFTC